MQLQELGKKIDDTNVIHQWKWDCSGLVVYVLDRSCSLGSARRRLHRDSLEAEGDEHDAESGERTICIEESRSRPRRWRKHRKR